MWLRLKLIVNNKLMIILKKIFIYINQFGLLRVFSYLRSYIHMNSHKNLLVRDPKQAQLAVFKNDEAEVMAKFLNDNYQ